MNKLLSAGFMRLKKSKIFRILFLFMFGLGLYVPIGQYLNMKKYGYAMSLDSAFFMYVTFMSILIAVFCSLFIGTEYSDGTIRNKLIVGHSRTAIYLSNLIVCITAGILIAFAYMAACACAGFPLLGGFAMGARAALLFVLSAIVIDIAFTSLFTLTAMLIQNKAAQSVAAVIGAFVLLMGAAFLHSSLSSPEMVSDYIMDETGEVKQTDPVPNPSYISGTKREIYEFLMEFLPSGQDILLMNGDFPMTRAFSYDVLILFATTGVGIFAFRKKDIK